MSTPKLSVIIPVFNNLATLPRILELLEKQNKTMFHEVVAVDNGSTDGTLAFLYEQQKIKPGYLNVLVEGKRGAGSARNTGAMTAKSPILLFLGGDILPAENLLLRHYQVHLENPDPKIGCLGFVTWDRTLPPTPFMVYLEHGGPQNAFGEIAGKNFVDPRKYFYGSNISLKKKMFEDAGGFDTEHFSGYGWEDLELGIRLADRGFKLFYEPQARGWHSHKVTLENVERRMMNVGMGYVMLKKLHPNVEGLDLAIEHKKYWLRRLVFGGPIGLVVSFLASWCETRIVAKTLFRRAISLPFYIGVHQAMQKKGKSVDKVNS
ncbi:MAG: glycosyltransferase [bacterium]|nr:glycosyltransferase [bacterium]